MKQKGTAILYFSRNLQDEYEAKGFGMSFPQFQKLYQFLQNKAQTLLNETGIPVFESYSTHQFCNGFGERLTLELEKVKAQGYDSVIVIGNDVPQLSLIDLQTAYSNLQKGIHTIGADHRGGAYLIAFSFNTVNLESLQRLSWQSPSIYEELRSLLNEPEELKEKIDLNRKSDIIDLIEARSLERGIRQFFISLFRLNHLEVTTSQGALEPQFKAFLLRGPPMQVAIL